MEGKAPTWLNEQFLATALQVDFVEVKIVKFSTEPVVSAGTNYTSHMYRVQVDYEAMEHSGVLEKMYKSLMVKIPIVEGLFKETKNFFDKEPKMYNEMLPKMSKKVKCEFGPESFKCNVGNGMVLQDLTALGYRMCDKFKNLDFHHCENVISTLAKFHAASVACYQEDPELIEIVSEELLYKDGAMSGEVKVWSQYSIKHACKILKEMPGQEVIADALSSKEDTIWESVINIFKPKTKGLNVLNHGDCWTNNLLFKYDDSGEITDVKLIDFQLCRFGSPVLDLIFFIWTSASTVVREIHLKQLSDIYLNILNKTLEDLGCEERLSAEELEKDFKSASDWALVAICQLLPFMQCESKEAMNLENLKTEDLKTIGTDERFKRMYNSKNFRALLPIVMRQFLTWSSS